MLIESLESRRLFAVTLTQPTTGNYLITGDSAANSIAMTWNNTGYLEVRVSGVLLGTANNADTVKVQSLGGNDYVETNIYDSDGFAGRNPELTVETGDGNDIAFINAPHAPNANGSVTVYFYDSTIDLGAGDDSCFISNAHHASILGGDGNDTIWVQEDCDQPVVSGGNGNDIIDLRRAESGCFALGYGDNDTIYGSKYNDWLDGGAGTGDYLELGSTDGPDTVRNNFETIYRVVDVTITQTSPGVYLIEGGSDADDIEAWLASNSVLTVTKFGFSDHVISGVTSFTIKTHGGDDDVIVFVDDTNFWEGPRPTFSVESGDGNDYVYADGDGYDSVYGFFDSTIYLGGGNDYAEVIGSYYTNIWCGDGNDEVRMWQYNHFPVLYGEGGNDILNCYNVTGDAELCYQFGGAGDDTIYSSGYRDYIEGNEGNDVLWLHDSGDEDDHFTIETVNSF